MIIHDKESRSKHKVLFVTNYHKLFMNLGPMINFWIIHDNS